MSYRTILAHLETPAQAEKVLPAAIMLCKAQQAHLIGLHSVPAPAVGATFGYELPPDIWEGIRQRAVAKGEGIRDKFHTATEAESPLSAEWHMIASPVNDVSDIVLDHGRRADIIVTGQIDPDAPEGANTALTGNLILECGRPVLVIPYAGTTRSLGETVFVAWNGSRESSRAVFDAMPLLVGAKEVFVYGVRQDSGTKDSPMIPGAELATALARHDVNAIVENSPASTGSVANDLLSRMADRGCDLLVMGGYGRSRAREFVFGGATRDILRSMTAPVLMSH